MFIHKPEQYFYGRCKTLDFLVAKFSFGYFVGSISQSSLQQAPCWALLWDPFPERAVPAAAQNEEPARQKFHWFCCCNFFRYPQDGAAILWLNLALRLEKWQRKCSRELESGMSETLHISHSQLVYVFDKYRWTLIAVNKTFIKIP